MTNELARRAGPAALLLALLACTWSCSSLQRRGPAAPAGDAPAGTAPQPSQPEPAPAPQPDGGAKTEAVVQARAPLEPFSVTLPGGLVEIEMLPVPGGTYLTAQGAREIEPFFLARTETTWDAFDVLVFRLDLPQEERQGDVDGLTRPTKPYISVDRGFGHAGYPALSMSLQGAQAFCDWLSEETGRRFRLPTVLEHDWASRAMSQTPYGCGPIEALPEHAWFRDNSQRKTHPVGEKRPNPWGFHDLHGNVAEWALTPDGGALVMGGAFSDPDTKLAAGSAREPSAAWNASDPQVPKSVWWLADANFVGFRIACDPQGDN